MFLKSSLQNRRVMRTKGQQRAEMNMATLKEIHSIVLRAQPTLVGDAIGAAALVVMLVVGLHLPVLA